MSSYELSYGEITAASEVLRFGEFDYATPWEWMMADPEKRRHYCWFYPHAKPHHRRLPSSRPLSYRVLARLALRMERRKGIPDLSRWAKLWAYVHPGKEFDRDGIAAIRRLLAEDGCLHGLTWLFERLHIPPPPPGTFAEVDPLAEAA